MKGFEYVLAKMQGKFSSGYSFSIHLYLHVFVGRCYNIYMNINQLKFLEEIGNGHKKVCAQNNPCTVTTLKKVNTKPTNWGTNKRCGNVHMTRGKM